ncbi:glycosyltransferase [Mariniblastus sp.]|nr:glycosyltransferase [Mariniblastus sp.]
MKISPKKILIHYPVLNVGGAENSTLRLMNLMLEHDWTVHLVLTTGGGALEGHLDPRIKVTRLRSKPAGDRFKQAQGMVAKLLSISDLLRYGWSRVEELFRSVPFLFRKYDAAMVALHGLSPRFVCRWVNAKKRFQWIRSDLTACDPSGKAAKNIKQFGTSINYYLCVAETVRQSIITIAPTVADKAVTLNNVLEINKMRATAEKAHDPYPKGLNGLKVVTVCRLQDKSKGIFRMVDVHQELNAAGIHFHWFVVGDGKDQDQLKRRIDATELTDRFILVGRKENPFPYYRFADLSATLSNYEGLCGTVNEAKACGKPVIATRFSGIDEQITHGKNGWIVENNHNAIVSGLRRMLTDRKLRESITNDDLPTGLTDDDGKLAALCQMIES